MTDIVDVQQMSVEGFLGVVGDLSRSTMTTVRGEKVVDAAKPARRVEDRVT